MLDPTRLRRALAPLFSGPSMPSTGHAAVEMWCRAYAEYATNALAGGTTTTLSPQAIGDDFLVGLNTSIRAMWMSAAWVGPGLVGTTAVAPPVAPYVLGHSTELLTSYDADRGLSLIVESLHSYTMTVTVSVVSAGGTPAIFTVT